MKMQIHDVFQIHTKYGHAYTEMLVPPGWKTAIEGLRSSQVCSTKPESAIDAQKLARAVFNIVR